MVWGYRSSTAAGLQPQRGVGSFILLLCCQPVLTSRASSPRMTSFEATAVVLMHVGGACGQHRWAPKVSDAACGCEQPPSPATAALGQQPLYTWVPFPLGFPVSVAKARRELPATHPTEGAVGLWGWQVMPRVLWRHNRGNQSWPLPLPLPPSPPLKSGLEARSLASASALAGALCHPGILGWAQPQRQASVPVWGGPPPAQQGADCRNSRVLAVLLCLTSATGAPRSETSRRRFDFKHQNHATKTCST